MSAPAHRDFLPMHLLELFEPSTGDIVFCDCFGRLELALEQALVHVRRLPEPSSPDCSFDVDAQLEGVSFFDSRQRMTVCLTVYHLDRDTASAADPQLTALCNGPLQALQRGLDLLATKDLS